MAKILVAGAGKSSIYLIQYLLTHAPRNKWEIIVADADEDAINQKIGNHPNGYAIVLDINNQVQRRSLVEEVDFVVSLMPAHLHLLLAQDCLLYKKNLITSSYISPEMRAMDGEVKEAGLMFMCEMGLDPGIDHMTAADLVHGIQKLAGTITSFKSYCGGLIAPESDDNPWHYKFSWNPRNIITAGTDGAHYKENSIEKTIRYRDLFKDDKTVAVKGLGKLAYYPNRDSLSYLKTYDVEDANTFLRATLRHPDFCKGWDAVIQIGLTDMNDALNAESLTYAQWLRQKISMSSTQNLVEGVASFLNLPKDDKVLQMLEWLGLFNEDKIRSTKTFSGEILLDLLLEKWVMKPQDKDMVVMQHEVEYTFRNKPVNMVTTMVIKGEDREHSAMAKTVGLPMGILTRMVMNNKLSKLPLGVQIPNMASVYRPVLKELEHHGIEFHEEYL